MSTFGFGTNKVNPGCRPLHCLGHEGEEALTGRAAGRTGKPKQGKSDAPYAIGATWTMTTGDRGDRRIPEIGLEMDNGSTAARQRVALSIGRDGGGGGAARLGDHHRDDGKSAGCHDSSRRLTRAPGHRHA